jgi:FkbM family methyltransferase
MISFAQNQEDVVLFRLTKLVDNGIFVDVGASHPVLENVTYALYKSGWRGVNIEPMAREASLLRELRPDDVNIEAAAGREAGEIILYEAPLENRGATTYDVRTADRYREIGQRFTEFKSPVITLDSVLSKYNSGDVHILKIDVEGLEKEVLLGANLKQHQPWVVVIESTRPNSQEDSSFEWEFLVLSCGYKMVLFDGLNRFYVREDLSEIQDLMSYPANVFDSWESHQTNSAVEYAVSLRTALDARDNEISNMKFQSDARIIEISNAKVEIDSLRGSLDLAKNEITELSIYIQALLESIERIEK